RSSPLAGGRAEPAGSRGFRPGRRLRSAPIAKRLATASDISPSRPTSTPERGDQMVTRGGSRTLFGALVLSLALLLPVALIAADGTQAAKKTFKIRKGNAKPAWD